jgi:hypothetical protein
MAKCQRQDIEVKVERTERLPGYALTLTKQEAVTLLRVLNRVGVTPKSPTASTRTLLPWP